MKHEVAKGRGATLQIEGRFESVARERFDDGWGGRDEELPLLKTTVTVEKAKSIIQRHESPDLPFDYSLNAYRGCEHGCIYCYARPSHGYLNLSPGLDFETKLFAAKRVSFTFTLSNHAAISRYSTTLDGAGTGKPSSRSPSI